MGQIVSMKSVYKLGEKYQQEYKRGQQEPRFTRLSLGWIGGSDQDLPPLPSRMPFPPVIYSIAFRIKVRSGIYPINFLGENKLVKKKLSLFLCTCPKKKTQFEGKKKTLFVSFQKRKKKKNSICLLHTENPY